MKVALVHDWITGLRGGERCLQQFIKLYPKADIFTLVHVPGSTDPEIDRRVKETSYLSSLPGIKNIYRHLLPLYPSAISRFDLSGYDLIISLSHAAAKNISVPKGVPHICYCFTPMRYIYDQRRFYFGSATPLLEPLLGLLRSWDTRHAQSVSHFVGISSFIKARIKCFYRREASVIFPPVKTDWIAPANGKQGEAFLYAGALVPYKRPELVIEAFNQLGLPLWVVGKGSEEAKMKQNAGKNIVFLGSPSDGELAEIYRRSKALIFPGIEDFGMVPIECMAAGRPVIGLYRGGLKDTINGLKSWEKLPTAATHPTGVFFRLDADPVTALSNGVRYFLDREEIFKPEWCVRQASMFSPERFDLEWQQFIDQYVKAEATAL